MKRYENSEKFNRQSSNKFSMPLLISSQEKIDFVGNVSLSLFIDLFPRESSRPNLHGTLPGPSPLHFQL